MHQIVYVGNYSNNGIELLQFDKKGNLKKINEIGCLKNNSYICKYKNNLYSSVEVYNSNINNFGYVAQYKLFDRENAKTVSKKSSYGKLPCFVTIDTYNDILYVCNYLDGSFVAYKLDKNGDIQKRIYYDRLSDKSNVHNIQFSKNYNKMYVVDLGLDRIIEYDVTYTNEKLKLIIKSVCQLEKNSKPRHIAQDDNNLYVITENSCEIYKLGHNDKDELIIVDRKIILPSEVQIKENYTGCAIKIDSRKKYLYVSIRGHNSISVFDLTQGDLQIVQNINCAGNCPRDISLDRDERFLLCANQISNDIAIFKVRNGKLFFERKYETEAPSCILFN